MHRHDLGGSEPGRVLQAEAPAGFGRCIGEPAQRGVEFADDLGRAVHGRDEVTP